MADFSDILRKTKQADADAVAQNDAEYKRKKDDRRTKVDAAIVTLDRDVIPIVEKAQAALRADGMASIIDKKYDVYSHGDTVWPSVIFKCASPPRPSDKYIVHTGELHIVSDGRSLKMRYEANAINHEEQADYGSFGFDGFEEKFAGAFERIVANYMKMMRDLQLMGSWR